MGNISTKIPGVETSIGISKKIIKCLDNKSLTNLKKIGLDKLLLKLYEEDEIKSFYNYIDNLILENLNKKYRKFLIDNNGKKISPTPFICAIEENREHDIFNFINCYKKLNLNLKKIINKPHNTSRALKDIPLIVALKVENHYIISLLIDVGANLDYTDFQGRTILILSILQNLKNISTIDLLLKYMVLKNIDINRSANVNRTALDWAYDCNQFYINKISLIELIKNYGGSANRY